MESADLPRKLGLLDAAAIVVGIVVGSAIFIVPSSVAQNLPSPGLMLAVWAFTGVLSFFGALAYAELGAMMPATGGDYVFLREAYGPLWAFLCGWTFFLVIQSGNIATVAVAMAPYLSYFVPLTPALSKAAAVGLIAALTLVNYRGVEAGAAVQKTFTFLKMLGLAVLIGSALFGGGRAATAQLTPAGFSWDRFGVAMIGCLFAYEGWNQISFLAGEVKRPERNLPLAILLGLALIIAVYLLANVAYMRALTVPEIAASDRVAGAAAERTMGRFGAALVSLTILLSIISTTNGGILAVPRIYFAQARDGLFFRTFGEIHPRFQTPAHAILLQGAWSSILALSGTFQQLFSYVIFAAWIFYAMVVVGVIVLRRKHPEKPRPYRMWGYPVTPLLFAAIASWFVLNTLITTPRPSLAGLAVIASGVPVYHLWRPLAAKLSRP